MATPEDHEEAFLRLSPEAEAIRAVHPDIRPASCEILGEGWRTYGFSPAEIGAWLLAGFDPDRDWYAAALRDEHVTPPMLSAYYRHRGTREQEQLINVVLCFLHDQHHPGELSRLLDQWGVQRSAGREHLRAG